MYRSKLWTMRMFAGFGTAEDTNVRFRELLRSGQRRALGRLRPADADGPRLRRPARRRRGRPLRRGGRHARATSSDLFAGIDLGDVTTSMTINSPAAILLAMYVAAAAEAGVPSRRLGGTIQNDMLKEYQAQKEYVFPPRPSHADRHRHDPLLLVRRCRSFIPFRSPATTSARPARRAAQELAFTLANGFAYVEAALAAGQKVDEFAAEAELLLQRAHRLLRGDREVPSGAPHLGPVDARALRRAARRARASSASTPRPPASSLTAQQPEVNIVRTAIEALAGVLGGTQSLHTNSMDEVLALPTERAARIALRTQQVIAHETGVANVADPLGGSWFVEALTDELEREAEAVFAYLDELGEGSILEGVYLGIDQGYFQGEIADAAYVFERKVSSGRRVVVGVNAYEEGNEEDPPPTLRIGQEVEDLQLKRLCRGAPRPLGRRRRGWRSPGARRRP